jgi:branched-chain amino acid transport system substrate-binding protein
MKTHAVISALAGIVLAGVNAQAEPFRIGVAAPLSGSSSLLGEQIGNGAKAAASADADVELVVADDACTAAGGAEAAHEFVASEVRIVVGFLCTESIEAALPILKQAKIPVIAVGQRADSLTDRRERTGWPVVRLGPRADGEREAAGQILTRLWRNELFAVIDDGTIYGRELAESFRISAEQAGLKPVFVDTFRPQLDNQIGLIGRLRKAGATHVFAGGDRDDIAIMARDAEKIGADMIFAGGEALRAAPGDVPLAPGTLMVGLPEWADIANRNVVTALIARKIQPDGYVLPAFAAVEIATAAVAEASVSGKPLETILTGGEFATVLGPISFDAKGDLSKNPYGVFRFDGAEFTPVDVE